MAPADTADGLRTKLTNYRRTRQSSPKSLHRSLDALIADAEKTLHLLTQPDAESPPAPPPPPPLRCADVRRTYPFDENAPWQRIG